MCSKCELQDDDHGHGITSNQEDCQNAIESRITDLKRRLEINENRCYLIDDTASNSLSHAVKLCSTWQKFWDYCDGLDTIIESLNTMQREDDFEAMADYLNEIKYQGYKWKSW